MSKGVAGWCGAGVPQQAFRAQVFAYIGPLDALSGTGNFPVVELFRSGVEGFRTH